MKTECGVLGVWTPQLEMVNLIKPFLLKLQHRGQDSCGIGYLTSDSSKIEIKKYLGKVDNLINIDNVDESQYFIGHTRYTTSSKERSLLESAHPISGNFKGKDFAFVFNGNIPDVENDTEYIRDFFANSELITFYETLTAFVNKVSRAYNIVFLYDKKLWITRDTYGTRPLSIWIGGDGTIVTASETCVFDELKEINSGFTTEIQPGNITVVNNGYIKNYEVKKMNNTAFCLFEYIYFMKPTSESMIKGKTVGETRNLFGIELAKQEAREAREAFNPDDTVVSSIPNTANDYARGYAIEMGIPYVQVIKKRSSSMRTFIEPSQIDRITASEQKYIYDSSGIKGKNVILVDDSIVRGITIKNISDKLREFEPKSIHIRVGCPPITNTCNLGVDMSSHDELIANRHLDTESIRDTMGVDSLIYLKLENINEVINLSNFCSGCMNGNYNSCENCETSKNIDW